MAEEFLELKGPWGRFTGWIGICPLLIEGAMEGISGGQVLKVYKLNQRVKMGESDSVSMRQASIFVVRRLPLTSLWFSIARYSNYRLPLISLRLSLPQYSNYKLPLISLWFLLAQYSNYKIRISEIFLWFHPPDLDSFRCGRQWLDYLSSETWITKMSLLATILR